MIIYSDRARFVVGERIVVDPTPGAQAGWLRHRTPMVDSAIVFARIRGTVVAVGVDSELIRDGSERFDANEVEMVARGLVVHVDLDQRTDIVATPRSAAPRRVRFTPNALRRLDVVEQLSELDGAGRIVKLTPG